MTTYRFIFSILISAVTLFASSASADMGIGIVTAEGRGVGCSIIAVAEDLDWTPLLFILLGIIPIVLLRFRRHRH